jgi:hypothetical protein
VSAGTIPPATATSATPTTVCEGNAVTLQANTGAGLSYQWLLNGAAIAGANAAEYSAVNAGNYSVRVNAAGCENTSASITVTVNPLPTANATSATPTTVCEGNAVTLQANTGAGLSYQWLLNGAAIAGANAAEYSAVNAGNYSVRVNAAGCENTSASIMVTVNPVPTAIATSAAPTTICEGSAVTLQANAGVGLSYQWLLNGTAITGANAAEYSAVNAGNYSVRVNAAGCENTSASITITVNPVPTAIATSAAPTTICEGSAVTLQANAGAGLSYQWLLNGNAINGANAPTYNATFAGIYAVSITQNTCETTSNTIQVEVLNPAIVPVIELVGSTIVLLTEGNPTWYLNGEILVGIHETSVEVTSAGVYTCQLNVSDCASEFSNEILILPLNSEYIDEVDGWAYPNPAVDMLHIPSLTWTYAEVFSLSGQRLVHVANPGGKIDLRPLSNGIYLLRLGNEKTIYQQNFVVAH